DRGGDRRLVRVRGRGLLGRNFAVDGQGLLGAGTGAGQGIGALGVAPGIGARCLVQVEAHGAGVGAAAAHVAGGAGRTGAGAGVQADVVRRRVAAGDVDVRRRGEAGAQHALVLAEVHAVGGDRAV